MQPRPFPALPETTARVARTALRKGSLYLTIGNEIGHIFDDEDFRDLYALEGAPALSPAQLVLVLIFQALENLSDREAAEAVRARMDWKYALHLNLEDTGFDYSVLSEFRNRLAQEQGVQRVLDRVLERLRDLGLLKERGRQRTDSTQVLSVARMLSRLELVMETMRLVLEELAAEAPGWLRQVAQPHWVERYSMVWRGNRMPKSKAKRAELASSVGEDGVYLLQVIADEVAPERIVSLSAVQQLQKVWEQQYEEGPAGWQWRPAGTLPPAAELIATPHDSEAHYAERRGKNWIGYRLHFTETCDPTYPRLITHVELTPALRPDVAAVDMIHQELKRRGCLPERHLVDRGYMAGHTLADSQQNYGVDLFGPAPKNTSWQAKQEGGFTTEMFQIDWERKQVTCPQGQASSIWSRSHTRHGQETIHVQFPATACRACLCRTRCTRSKGGRALQFSPSFPALKKARKRQQADDFWEQYAPRAGIEGTISEAVQKHGARRSRYVGLQKTWLQEILLASAINLERAARWLMGNRPAATRRSRFATVMAAA
jgi:transposase